MVAQWKTEAVLEVFATEKVRQLSEKLLELGFGELDSAHVASAIAGSADYFVTTDDGILKRAHRVAEIKIIDPIQLVAFVEIDDEH